MKHCIPNPHFKLGGGHNHTRPFRFSKMVTQDGVSIMASKVQHRLSAFYVLAIAAVS
jgi:hypothetical protein